ncbi:MAG TPA: hypothetical protein VM347_30725, partial [Nonomuraea sp.]|nr:hypothetical protein [Nonomuraea sp.]
EFLDELPSEDAVRRAAYVFSDAAELSPVLAKGSVNFNLITAELRATRTWAWPIRALSGEEFAQVVEKLYDVPGSGPSSGPPAAPGPHHNSIYRGERLPSVIARRLHAAFSDWGARPFVLDPQDAVKHTDVVAPRHAAETTRMRAVDPRVAMVERRLFTVDAPGRPARRITEYTVRFACRDEEMSVADLGNFVRHVRSGLDQYVNHRHLMEDGSELRVQVEFVPTGRDGITVRHLDGSPSRGPLDFRYEESHIDLALKVMHQLGMDDVIGPSEPGAKAEPAAPKPVPDTRAVPEQGGQTEGGGPLVASDEIRAMLGQEYAYTLDPNTAIGAKALAEQAPTVQAHQLPSLTGSAHTVEVRRMWVRAADGTLRPVTQFTVTMRYEPRAGMSPEVVARTLKDIRDGVDLVYNHQHLLPLDGSQLDVQVKLERAPEGTPRGERFEVRRATKQRNLEDLALYENVAPIVHARQIGRLLGLEHEHGGRLQLAAEIATRTVTEAPSDGSHMGSVRAHWSYQHVKARLIHDQAGHDVPEFAGPRDRHLWALGGHLVRNAVPVPDLPLHRVALGAPAEVTPWSRADIEQSRTNIPRHIGRLLATGRFPAEGRPLLEHVRRLDRAVTIFSTGRVGDAVGPDALMPSHLRYADAVTETAIDIYGTSRDHSFAAEDLIRLHGLIQRLGGGHPSAAWLRAQVNELLGRAPGHPVTRAEAHFLGGLASRERVPMPLDREALARTVSGEPDAPVTVRIALDDAATPAQVDAARWGARAADILDTAPRELPAGESLRGLLESGGTGSRERLESWLERVIRLRDPVTGVQASLGGWSLEPGRLTYRVDFASGTAGLIATAEHVLELTPDGRVVAVHRDPRPVTMAERIDVQGARALLPFWMVRLENWYVGAGVGEIRHGGVVRRLAPP